jgi:SAM-dependent methyltransferase
MSHWLRRLSSAAFIVKSNNTCLAKFSEVFLRQGPVLDIGSYYPPGYEDLCDRRGLFPNKAYIGCDLRPGPGVNRIEDAENLRFPDSSAGAVLLLEILEHLRNPVRAIAEARRVLRDDGLLAISVPFSYRLHGFPTDYWRFTASGLHHLLQDFPETVVFSLGPRAKPATIFAVARKSKSDDFARQRMLFRESIESVSKTLCRQLFMSTLQERGREFLGLISGRADVSVSFFDPSQGGGYVFPEPSAPAASEAGVPGKTPVGLGGS